MSPCPEDNKSFYQRLQEAEGLDLRDNRGKRHELAIVLMGLVLALLSNRGRSLSSLHRHMKKHYLPLMAVLERTPTRCISRAQLPKVLAKVSAPVLDQIMFEVYGRRLTAAESEWFGVDGKELRGSIQSGAKRGVALVTAVGHQDQMVQGQDYYHGAKASEVPTVRNLLTENNLLRQKVSLDALHCRTETLQPIAAQEGVYLVGLKQNQKLLREQMSQAAEHQRAHYEQYEVEKGHGRITERRYQVYAVAGVSVATRWAQCDFQSLVRVERQTEEVKSGKQSREISYYLSNQGVKPAELCRAVRGHWQVETHNQVRDVTFQEDGLRLQDEGANHVLASLRTLATKLLGRTGCCNRVAQLEDFGDAVGELLAWLTSINFL